jgi:hypothetical protein
MKFSKFTFILASVALSSHAAFAAGGLHKHDASIASYSYNIPIIDASSSMNRPGTSLRDDIEKGYRPTQNPTPFSQIAPQQQKAPVASPASAPAQAPAVEAQPRAAAPQAQGSFSDVARGVAPVQQQPAALPSAPAAQQPVEPVTLSTPDVPAQPPVTAPQTQAQAAPQAPQQGTSSITVTGDNANGMQHSTAPAAP